MPAFSVNIEEVVDLLNLKRKPKSRSGASSFDVKCPFCDDPGYHLNINTAKNTYHCVRCMDATYKNTGVLDLYGRVALNTPLNRDNSKELFKALMKDLGRDDRSSTPERYVKKCTEAEEYREIEPASEDKLDAVYTALLTLPYLTLSETHRENLLKRGLTETDIAANGYASMTESRSLLEKIKQYDAESGRDDEIDRIRKHYQSNGLSEKKREMTPLDTYSDDDIVLGLKIAVDVIRQTRMYPDHVPGFYKLKDKWAFRSVDRGILIPTRNESGQIVGMQTRKDVKTGKGLRYMTVSSKGLDKGVTTAIARTHFPAGEKITKGTTVILTEGPLKSDAAYSIAARLGMKNYAFIALQGVNSTRELPQIAKMLSERGISEVKDGFDMDKLVNPEVFKAMKTAQRILKENGNILLSPLFWDSEYAKQKENQMEELCKRSNLKWEKTGHVYSDVVRMSRVLRSHKIDYDFIVTGNKRERERWSDKTKGIDDYLLSVLETAETAAEL